LHDANGTNLGTILPWSTTTDWSVWDGTKQVTYTATGLPYQAYTSYPIAYASSDCTGPGMLVSALPTRPDGRAQIWGLKDPTEYGGLAYYEITAPALVSTGIASVEYSTDGGCGTWISPSGGGWQIVLGNKVQRPAMPLIPVVIP
jgi:hypothetical protein